MLIYLIHKPGKVIQYNPDSASSSDCFITEQFSGKPEIKIILKYSSLSLLDPREDAPPPRVRILSFSCSFRQKICTITPTWELAPHLRQMLDPTLAVVPSKFSRKFTYTIGYFCFWGSKLWIFGRPGGKHVNTREIVKSVPHNYSKQVKVTPFRCNVTRNFNVPFEPLIACCWHKFLNEATQNWPSCETRS